ncbi:MAG: hypothetical protein [Siphoviridae sp. ctCJE6]|nr:MAG: hypothetical protein [Siphoviridae sp. ctCJE6]
MAFNVPSYTVRRFTFGPGILYMGAAGSTPAVDIGAVKGDAEVSVQRVALELKQGSPQSLVKKFAVEENVSLKVTGVEWNWNNLSYALGAGVTSQVGAAEVFEFGGDLEFSTRALRYVHIMPDGSTIDIHVFSAEGLGELVIALKETDFHEFPYQFNALEGSVDFTNSALASNKKKFKIIHTKA